MYSEKLALKPINDLLTEKFYIPAYQRGYRWKDTQVKNLLDDIWNFRKECENKVKESFYCLQPIVVSKKENEWEVIDGQQRLTTIYLILYYLNDLLPVLGKANFSIRYETRSDSEQFLKQIDFNHKEKSIDHFHFCQALGTIGKWFSEKDGTIRIHFLTTLLNNDELGKNVKVIWYDVSDENMSHRLATDIFTRLNIGKIPLTNAELIKALFLNKSGAKSDLENRNLKQINIATEWDKIEQTLQEKDFWYFISNAPTKYETRIEYIFDLIKGKKEDHENYFTFYQFSAEFDQQKDDPTAIDKIWLRVKEYFLSFEEWYQDRQLYHLIGYLVTMDVLSIQEIKGAAKGQKKSEFKHWLKGKALKSIKKAADLDSINFDDDKKEIRKTLLLFNVLSILDNPTSLIRLPFYQYRIQPWDIEHIRARTSKDIQGKDRKYWAITLLEYFTGISWEEEEEILSVLSSLEEENRTICENLLKILKSESAEDAVFSDVYEELKAYFKENEHFEEIDGISNLALLDEATNRMYKNAFFPVKRKHIIQQEKRGVFIPLCTRNVFLKAYSQKLGNLMHWNSHDAHDYLTEIKRILTHEHNPTKQ